ncbi:four-carbon acid sugar kinase family protein [Azospirillum sp. SYSU D00513]|uniref:four-carbon acid sugar kinase family protein n=1 Tax=Azospirillum sp. SYSU D00513 TaxID=2812561 RepID=UPI001A9580B8
MTAPRLGWYGDDFTGATDTLAAVARAGLRALLFLEVPDAARLAAAGPLDAVGIAGAARTMEPAAMAAELEPVGRFLAGLATPVIHYKTCSTFDSAPGIGSIGAAVAILRRFAANPFVPIVGGQPNIGRYLLFSTLFAAAGTGGAVHRLDRHPTMKAHPVTPMAEADLRLHLEAQGLADIAALHYPDYELDPEELDRRLDRLVGEGAEAVLLDVARPADLATVGRLIWERARRAPLLAVGPTGVAQALVAHWQGAGEMPIAAPAEAPPSEAPLGPAEGPVFVMAGSLSPVTRAQVEAARSFDRMPADALRLRRDPAYGAALLEEAAGRLREGRNLLVWTAPPEGAAPDTASAAAVADATATFAAELLRRVPMRRVGIAGGDTSSKAVKALGLWGLSYRAALAPGVTLCRTRADRPESDGVELMLKGGQMGPPDLFERLARGAA